MSVGFIHINIGDGTQSWVNALQVTSVERVDEGTEIHTADGRSRTVKIDPYSAAKTVQDAANGINPPWLIT